MKKNCYPPLVVEVEFYLEQSIAVGSTNLTFGGRDPEDNVPLINDDYETSGSYGWETEIF
jgi:hypothetical protein